MVSYTLLEYILVNIHILTNRYRYRGLMTEVTCVYHHLILLATLISHYRSDCHIKLESSKNQQWVRFTLGHLFALIPWWISRRHIRWTERQRYTASVYLHRSLLCTGCSPWRWWWTRRRGTGTPGQKCSRTSCRWARSAPRPQRHTWCSWARRRRPSPGATWAAAGTWRNLRTGGTPRTGNSRPLSTAPQTRTSMTLQHINIYQ